MHNFLLNFGNMCRTCCGEFPEKSLRLIHDAESSVADLIYAVSNLKVENDELPQQICDKCYESLSCALAIKQSCEKSYVKLCEIYQKFLVETGASEQKLEDFEDLNDLIEEDPGPDSADGKDDDNESFTIVEEFVEGVKKVRFQCSMCEKHFSRSNHVKRHILTGHSNLRPFKCDCGKSFTRKDHLAKHVLSHTAKTFHCDICEKVFARSESLKVHKKRHELPIAERRLFDCSICKKSFTTAKYLEQHAEKHKGPHKFDCKFCPMQFQTRKEVNEHSKLHINERPYLCTQCGKRFLRNDYLVVHMRRHTGDKPYKCSFCNKGFPRATDLNVHERYHTNEKTHLCNLCGKGFQRAYNLLVHIRTHTGEKPYRCPHCVKSFTQGNDLKAHIRRHTGERYRCDVCNEAFIQGYLLSKHKRDAHNIHVTSHIRRLEKFISPTQEQNELLESLSRNEMELRGKMATLDENVIADENSRREMCELKNQITSIEDQRQKIMQEFDLQPYQQLIKQE